MIGVTSAGWQKITAQPITAAGRSHIIQRINRIRGSNQNSDGILYKHMHTKRQNAQNRFKWYYAYKCAPEAQNGFNRLLNALNITNKTRSRARNLSIQLPPVYQQYKPRTARSQPREICGTPKSWGRKQTTERQEHPRTAETLPISNKSGPVAGYHKNAQNQPRAIRAIRKRGIE